VFNVTHALLPALRQTRGTIINIGSIASFVGVGDTLGYAPSKGGVKLLTRRWPAIWRATASASTRLPRA